MTICRYCMAEVSEREIEAEDGCCPECGALLSAGGGYLRDEDDYDDIDELEDDFDYYDEEDDDGEMYSWEEYSINRQYYNHTTGEESQFLTKIDTLDDGFKLTLNQPNIDLGWNKPYCYIAIG